jgi:hypothetical protein
LSSDLVEAVYSWGPVFKEKPGWQRIRGVIEGRKVVFKFGAPSDPVTVFLYPPRSGTILMERLEKGKYRRGWLYTLK